MSDYPGSEEQAARFEAMILPACQTYFNAPRKEIKS